MNNSFKIHIALPKKAKKLHKIDYNIESLPGEIWKDLKDYEGFYKISNLGRVKHLGFKPINKRDTFAKRTFIVATKLSRGYRQLNLCDKYGNNKLYYLHKLVAENFIPNPNNYQYVNHKDENKENNIVSNLEWCDAYYNNTYNNRHKSVGYKIRKYINIIKVKDNEEIIDTIKISDIRNYHISYQALYKYLNTDKLFYSIANNCYYKFKSI